MLKKMEWQRWTLFMKNGFTVKIWALNLDQSLKGHFSIDEQYHNDLE